MRDNVFGAPMVQMRLLGALLLVTGAAQVWTGPGLSLTTGLVCLAAAVAVTIQLRRRYRVRGAPPGA